MHHVLKNQRALSLWLLFVAGMVMVMAIIGAITRLTESGLSIVEWKPFTGAIPPLSDADWMREFTAYQTSPQYQHVNHGMTLAEYQNIFWWEWIHRQWGRAIGLVYAIGLAWFWLRRQIPQKYKMPLLGILGIGLAQGVMGWLMVASGLDHNPAVSHYRLAAHLFLAVVLYLACLWLGLDVRRERGGMKDFTPHTSNLMPVYKHSIAALGMVMVTLVWGAFTAGLRAGLVYNTWPLMDGQWTPDNFWHLQPWWMNFFENHGVVQYVHRTLGYITSLMCISIGIVNFVRRVPPPARAWGYAVCAMGFFQPTLGIITVLTQVHLHTAVAHQAGAFILMGLLVVWLFELCKLMPQK